MRAMRLALFGAALCAAGSAQAKLSDKVPQELLLGDTVYTQDAGELQMALSGEADRHSERNDYRAGLSLELGLTDQLQLQGELPLESRFQSGARDTGIDNVEVGLQWMASSLKPLGPDLSFVLRFQLPTAAEEDQRAFASELSVIGHQRIAGPVHGQLLLGGGVYRASADGSTEPLGDAVATLYATLNGWFPVLQGQVRHEDDWKYALSPGVIWHPGGNLEVGLWAPVRFEEQTSFGASLTLVYQVELGGGQG